MSKEYRTLTFEENAKGRREMAKEIDTLANAGWELKDKEVIDQGWSVGKTAVLGFVFPPLALAGKKTKIIQIVMERESTYKV